MVLFDFGCPPHIQDNLRPSRAGTSLGRFHELFPDEQACLRYVFDTRFGADHVCPTCQKPVRWAISKGRRMLVHRTCKKHISPYAGTAMEHSRIPTQLWFYAMLHLANSVDGASAGFISRQLGIHYTSAQTLLYRIRLHLAAIDAEPIQPCPDNAIYLRLAQIRGAYIPGPTRHNVAHVLHVASGARVNALVITRRRGAAAKRMVQGRVAGPARFVTDCIDTANVLNNYGLLKRSFVEFSWDLPESHLAGRAQVTAFLEYFRKGLRSQQLHVHQKHLWLYLKEYEFRFNRRHKSETVFAAMISEFPSIGADQASRLEAISSDFQP